MAADGRLVLLSSLRRKVRAFTWASAGVATCHFLELLLVPQLAHRAPSSLTHQDKGHQRISLFQMMQQKKNIKAV